MAMYIILELTKIQRKDKLIFFRFKVSYFKDCLNVEFELSADMPTTTRYVVIR